MIETQFYKLVKTITGWLTDTNKEKGKFSSILILALAQPHFLHQVQMQELQVCPINLNVNLK